MTSDVMSSATGTPRGFYRAFCTYLASLGAAVLSYDYRGTFEPVPTLRASSARMRDWGTLDFPGVVDWMSERYPSHPLYAVGHSVGGHVLLMTDRSARIAGALSVAAQSGYWRYYRGFERYRVRAFAKTIVPALTRVFAYFPGDRVVFGTKLAPGILREWRRWCVSEGYFFDDPSMRDVLVHGASLNAPIAVVGVTDDPWGTARAIDALLPAFTRAAVSRLTIDPSDYGLQRVGHLGFFRPANGAALWPIAARALHLTTPLSKEYA